MFAAPIEVHPQHAIPVGRVEVPEREAELPRTDAGREDDVIDAAESRANLIRGVCDRCEFGHVGAE